MTKRACVLILAIAGVLAAAAARPADEPTFDLARRLTGWWEGAAGPDNKLRILFQPAGSSSAFEYRYDVTIQGKYDGTNVSLYGSLALAREGESARIQWATARGGCDAPLKRAGDGFRGETLAGACMTAFQKPVPGKWIFEIEPGSFAVRSAESGETLRFRKAESEK
jgi:hypothetical protein